MQCGKKIPKKGRTRRTNVWCVWCFLTFLGILVLSYFRPVPAAQCIFYAARVCLLGKSHFSSKKSYFYLWLSFNFISLDFFSKNLKEIHENRHDIKVKLLLSFHLIAGRRRGSSASIGTWTKVGWWAWSAGAQHRRAELWGLHGLHGLHTLCASLLPFSCERETEMKFRWKNVLPTFPTSPVFLFHQVLSFFLPWFGAAFDTFVFGDSTDLGCLRGASSPLGSSHATDADGRSHAYPPVSSGQSLDTTIDSQLVPTSPNYH